MNTLFKALDDGTRRDIIEMLRKRDMMAGEIAAQFHISKPSISYHLQLLQQADLVVAVKEGQYVRYSLNTTVVQEAITWLMKLTKKGKK
ncbi:MAG: autorepressor SdpR family transcription factor [Candidatus Kapaibacterium sp.]